LSATASRSCRPYRSARPLRPLPLRL
jgi:hypothetical protein